MSSLGRAKVETEAILQALNKYRESGIEEVLTADLLTRAQELMDGRGRLRRLGSFVLRSVGRQDRPRYTPYSPLDPFNNLMRLEGSGIVTSRMERHANPYDDSDQPRRLYRLVEPETSPV